MGRYRLLLEYDGSGFRGWQRQREGIVTVQGVLEEGLRRLFGHDVTLVGAGRTDTGVHATGQVAHFDTVCPREGWVILRALNVLTPETVTVLAVEEAEQSFHARFSAHYREYNFRIMAGRSAMPALDRRRVWHHPRRLDIERMAEAAQLLLGTHDFTAFRASFCQSKEPIKTVSRMDVVPVGQEIHIRVGANGFLQHMVRNIVGTLSMIGRGEWPVGMMAEILASRDRRRAGPTVPPWGLYLEKVLYPGDVQQNS
ncbi:tRNA pseudouridine(38-40) synthase TruA [Candidatus Magnetaquicoccus inordinatus]|uniref:tRNA pseudouridine(38-40) synthase TruA n=1 Tax=Candidatus Magnetaquicoccus inordinatus TaxID=2496818 RepID=UPI00102B48D0|nr:tRNA pseudouridine(38-40) synthase TruA [Candidatus Magnetaquicoccus inordinatus]